MARHRFRSSEWSNGKRLAQASLLLVAAFTAWSAAPQRIVSTTPAITEMLFALGLGPRVAGVSSYCAYPPEVKKLPKVGGFVNPNIEAIVALHPDLVVIQKNPIRLASQLERVHLRAIEVKHDAVADVLGAIRQLADAAGVEAAGRSLTAAIQADLDAVRKATERRPRTTMAFIIGRNPGSLEGLTVVGRGTYLNDLVEIAGGTNVFASALGAYPKVTIEALIAKNPEVIVDMGDMSQTGGITDEHKKAIVSLWGKFPALHAVAGRKVFAVADDIYVVPGPRMTLAAQSFARMLHPEASR